jgi:hypothetical protein
MQNSFLRNSKSNIRSQWYTYTYFKKILNNWERSQPLI